LQLSALALNCRQSPDPKTVKMSTDYAGQKVPDLKKLLSERGLAVSGNKADLIARLEEDDKKKSKSKPESGKNYTMRLPTCV
jgi:hypothetical protein